MEQTKDSLRPSDVSREESWIQARDPSILGFGQRPIPSDKRNLMSVFETDECSGPIDDSSSSSLIEPINLQTVKVYLRLKPFPRKVKLSNEELGAYKIVNEKTLETKLPSQDHKGSSMQGSKTYDTVRRTFTFSHTFGPETTQLQLFEQVIQKRMVDFLGGRNATVMTYGTTNSGKSYTLQGTSGSPGIIPRGLEYVFSNINTRPTPSYKPSHNSDVVSLSPVERAQELEVKNKLLTLALADKNAYINAYKEMQKLLQEESPIRPSQACGAQYSVWVSFAEIYNENIYDLLSNDCQKRRPLLKLGTDNYGRAFIKGLKSVSVNSGSEAFQVLMAGQYNLKVAATALNARSSRSHCIFTIKLLKYYIENKPENVEVSTFAFCDLAGSERLKKTLNVGERLKEAQNINTSLLVLGRCLKSIYEGQSSTQRHEHVGPFRESKLTRLFQSALSGKEPIILIVNVNPLPNLYIETQNVLNFSAIAKKIVVEPKKIKRKISHSRFSQIVAQSVKSSTDWNETELGGVIESSEIIEESALINQDDYDELLEENEGLKTEIQSLKKEISTLKASMFSRDVRIRQELADMYTAMMNKLETDWKNRIRDVEEQQENYHAWSVNKLETFYTDKINELTSRKRRRSDCEDDDDENSDTEMINELEIENQRLTTKVQSVKEKFKKLQADYALVSSEKNKFAFDLSLMKEELKNVKTLLKSAEEDLYSDEESMAYINNLKSELEAKQERIKDLKIFLNEAKEEYISITSYAENMDHRLKETEQHLAERRERVSDLEELLEQVNICLAESTKKNETLEERVSAQSKQLREADEREQILQAKLIESENTIQRLKAGILFDNPSSKSLSTTLNEKSISTETRIKDEVISEESEGEVSLETSRVAMPKDIIIKTDNDELIGIPATSYEDGRASEMFVEVREILTNDSEAETEASPARLRSKLHDSETENSVLKAKLAQSFEEIHSLKESLELMKQECNDITSKLIELKAAQDVETEKQTPVGLSGTTSNQASSSIFQRQDTVEQTQDEIPVIMVNDQILQTSFVETNSDKKSKEMIIIEERLRDSEEELEKLLRKYKELEDECKEKTSLVDQLETELQSLRVANNSLRQKSIDDDSKIEMLLKEIVNKEAILEKDLGKVASEKEAAVKSLEEAQNSLKALQSQMAECRDEYAIKISILEKELSASKEREQAVSKVEKAHEKKILELEEKINEINKSAERCQMEKKELEDKLNKNMSEIDALEKRLSQADKKEQEKDTEIRQLQKALKTQLSGDIKDKQMEKELKANLKELSETQESLRLTTDLYQRSKAVKNKEIDELKTEISVLSKKIKTYELKTHDDKEKMERLQRENEELTMGINQKEKEMETFMRNRDETNSKWEQLMKSKQEELNRSKIEIKRFQELFHRMPTTPIGKAARHEESIQTVDLNETGASATKEALPPPSTAEPKRSTRKKRLHYVDESCVDVESNDEIPQTPPSRPVPVRSLRSRKKK